MKFLISILLAVFTSRLLAASFYYLEVRNSSITSNDCKDTLCALDTCDKAVQLFNSEAKTQCELLGGTVSITFPPMVNPRRYSPDYFSCEAIQNNSTSVRCDNIH